MTRLVRAWHEASRTWARAAALLVLIAAAPAAVRAQQVVAGGDFDICDFCGTLRGNTAFLTGRAGFGTDRGIFVLVNAIEVSGDVDHDGYTPAPGVGYNNLAVVDTQDFVNLANPARFIRRTNFVLADFLNPLNPGFNNQVTFYVNIPDGTPAGDYKGRITIRDLVIPVGSNTNGEPLRVDAFFVQIHVVDNSGLGLVQADTAKRLDSLVIRGRPGSTASGVARIANLGNVDLANVRFDATDLVATSGTGLRIPVSNISFSPAQLTRVAIGDTQRVSVSVRIPAGLLAGPYRGDLIVQAENTPTQRVPLTVIVTGAGDIVYETNPVRGRNGDLAVIIFNGDPSTTWEMAIFDMLGVTTFRAKGTVFPGSSGTTTVPAVPGDQAVRFVWNLKNGTNADIAGGMYYVVVNATQDGKRRQLRSKLMVIR
ncbi:MAG: hypothetical protein ABJD07_05840 [Gemmatimonadaceae bacterium]